MTRLYLFLTGFDRLRLTRLLADNRPAGTKPEMDDVRYWHERCKQLGAVWSVQRTAFMVGAQKATVTPRNDGNKWNYFDGRPNTQ